MPTPYQQTVQQGLQRQMQQFNEIRYPPPRPTPMQAMGTPTISGGSSVSPYGGAAIRWTPQASSMRPGVRPYGGDAYAGGGFPSTNDPRIGQGGMGGYGTAGLEALTRYADPANWGTAIQSQYTSAAMRGIHPAYEQGKARINRLYAQRGMLGSSEHLAALTNLDLGRGRMMAGARDVGFERQQQFAGDWLDKLLQQLSIARLREPFGAVSPELSSQWMTGGG